MISRLRELDCAPQYGPKAHNFRGGRGGGINCDCNEYRIAKKRFALASRPCKRSVVPGKDPTSGAFDEAQVLSSRPAFVAERAFSGCSGGHCGKGPRASR